MSGRWIPSPVAISGRIAHFIDHELSRRGVQKRLTHELKVDIKTLKRYGLPKTKRRSLRDFDTMLAIIEALGYHPLVVIYAAYAAPDQWSMQAVVAANGRLCPITGAPLPAPDPLGSVLEIIARSWAIINGPVVEGP